MKALLPLFLILCCSAQTYAQGTPTDGSNSSDRKSMEAQWPVADYSTPDSSPPSKSVRHTGKDWVKAKVPPMVGESILFTDWEFETPALPLQMSDIVFVGKVRGLKAKLSSDKSDVYTEIEVFATEFLKGSAGAVVTIERRGGVVRFPDGRHVRYQVDGQRLPRAGCKYLFFAKRVEHDIELVTAYAIENEVQPLDGHQNSRFSEFKGVFATEFLDLVRKRVKEAEK